MKLSMLFEAIMSATKVAKVFRGPVALSAYLCAAICLSPAAAEDSQEVTENGEEIVENITTKEEETEASQIDFKEATEAALEEATLEDKDDKEGDSDDESEETGDDKAVEKTINTENLSSASFPTGGAGGAGGGAGDVSVSVEAGETTEELDIPQDENADVIAEALNIATETSEDTGTDYKDVAAVNSETEDSTSVTPIQQRFSSSSTDEGYTVSTGSTQQYSNSVNLSSGIDSGFGGSSSSGSGYSYAATASAESTSSENTSSENTYTESVSTVSEIPDTLITNQDVADGEVLAVKQKIIAENITPDVKPPDKMIEITGGGKIQVGDADSTGILYISRSETATDGQGTSITDTRISVTVDENLVDVRISSKDEFSSTASMTYVDLNLTQLKENLRFTIEHATVSASSIKQTSGEMRLVNHAGVSLAEGSQLQNIYVDKTSSFYSDAVSGAAQVTGNNTLEVAPRDGAGTASRPLPDGETLGIYQLYGLTFTEDSVLNFNMNSVNISDSLMEDGGSFGIYMNGVQWAHLQPDVYVQDLELLANSFNIYNFIDSSGVDHSDRLQIVGAYYSDRTQGLTLEINVLPASVPEPTTATLSLLALCTLAARRRRRV